MGLKPPESGGTSYPLAEANGNGYESLDTFPDSSQWQLMLKTGDISNLKPTAMDTRLATDKDTLQNIQTSYTVKGNHGLQETRHMAETRLMALTGGCIKSQFFWF